MEQAKGDFGDKIDLKTQSLVQQIMCVSIHVAPELHEIRLSERSVEH